jgi:uncharacterized circularly permuted ATP-grasp superfamily protein/uncharacterized alpha-E superfamily protein
VRESTLKSGKAKGGGAWNYVPTPGFWDESVNETGKPRHHWRRLASAYARMGPKEFARHWRNGQQLIQTNGITFNAYDDPQGREREWPMDPIPMVIDDANWAFVEKAVIQRATLLNHILADLYGPQTLIKTRQLPPELLFANPHFLRPCVGIKPPGGAYLHAYAVDLARSPNGWWWVLADRTQAPSGMGYALENRLVSARTFPQVFMKCQVRQLTRYFQTLRDGLLGLSPGNKSMPRAVILTPGPANEAYFEHAFLARHYNFTLVESADLTVRDDRVFLKTLAGLEPVDLILRRQDDSYCDPLELRSDSVLGIPGLVQAARKGNVAIANALGSGLLQTPVHMAFLPGLCRHLLGEELQLPSVATWWCGHEKERRYVLDNIRDLVIKPAFPRFDRRAVFGADLDQAGLSRLREEIETKPSEFVAQEKIALSMAPCWANEGTEPRHVVLRVFAAWDGQSYTVMPGGLTRVATAQTSMIVSLQMGGGSKDTWVTGATDEPAATGPIARPVRSHAVSHRVGSDLSSRTADNLFWLGRYAERVESTVRMVRTLLPSLSGEEDFSQLISLDTTLRMLVAFRHLPRELLRSSINEQRRQTERLLSEMIYDPARLSGIGGNLRHLRRVAWQLKERLSFDTWRVLQQLETGLTRSAPPRTDQRFAAQMDLLDDAILTLSAFAGLSTENKTRGLGWSFLDIGRRIERCLQTSQALRCSLVTAPEDARPFLDAVLQYADSAITYRRRYMSDLSTDCVLDLLLIDEQNPRAVGYQLATLAEHIRKLPERHDPLNRYPLEQKLIWKMLMEVRLAKGEELATANGAGKRQALAELLDSIQRDVLDLSEALTAGYLAHLAPSRLISSL